MFMVSPFVVGVWCALLLAVVGVEGEDAGGDVAHVVGAEGVVLIEMHLLTSAAGVVPPRDRRTRARCGTSWRSRQR